MGQRHAAFGIDDAQEGDRHRYNAAFGELGLEWYWDAGTYAELQSTGAARGPVHVYVERHVPHLLRAYETDFLVDAVESKRTQLHAALNA